MAAPSARALCPPPGTPAAPSAWNSPSGRSTSTTPTSSSFASPAAPTTRSPLSFSSSAATAPCCSTPVPATATSRPPCNAPSTNGSSATTAPRIPLTVTHTHSHGDHIAGDADLQALNDPAIPITYIAPTCRGHQEALYGIANWPEDIGRLDLGDRVLDLIPIPGHDTVSVALYDRQTAVLLTGDSVYPGRLYIADFDAFTRSNARLIRFTAGKPVAQVLGNHIEQTTTPFLDYPVGTMYQPNEHELQLSRGTLLEIQAGLDQLHGKPARVAFRDFSLWPVGPRSDNSPSARAAFEERQKRQHERMWDQTAPEPK